LGSDTIELIFETLITTEACFGKMATIKLKPGGADIPITEENKKEYVESILEFCNLHCLILNEHELELLIGSMSDISAKDRLDSTDYQKYETNDETYLRFWQATQSWAVRHKSRLLQFTAGTSQM
ncbi:hypothetical protein BS47DRAFT_1258799, partial [Hydnum rufescens UP504]